MCDSTEDFFKGKRPWSRIKDKILGSYMTPYVAKVMNHTGQPLLLIDAFAGPGRFEDGSPGSPLIMCKAAELFARGRYQAIFINKEKEYHQRLDAILQCAGWRSAATPVLGDGQILLRTIAPLLRSQSVFLYVDPFGLDCEFDTLEPFLNRNKSYSTEIVINLHAPILHRLAARDAYLSGTGDKGQIAVWHNKLTRTLGGNYWEEALLVDNEWDAKTREQLVVDGYKKRLSRTGYLIYTGSCPIQASRDGRTKYYMIFASRHPDAMLLFNDEMCKAFNEFMHEQETQDTLFAGQHWTTWRNIDELVDLIMAYVHNYPGKTRADLWTLIVKDHFMRFTSSEYIKAVKTAVDIGKIQCPTPYPSTIRPTKRLNDNCKLMPNS